MSKLTEDQVAQMAELRERGWSHQRIGMKFGVSPGAALYHCLKQGAFSPREKPRPVPTRPIAYARGDGRTMRLFTQAEDDQLIDLTSKGVTKIEIARRMGRARTSVAMRLLWLAKRDELADA
ncbi:hypothetical protein ACWPMX_07960 [Tsuneonella sp. HG094]